MFKNIFGKTKPKTTKIIAIASGKGGVGKSTTSVNLAYALKKQGFDVGILDADIYGPSLPVLVHKTEPILHNAKDSSPDKMIPPSYGGVKVISIGHFNEQIKAAVMRGPMVTSLVKQLLKSVSWGNLDYLLIDYPPGTGDIQITLSQSANLFGGIIVTTPQEIALSDVRKAVQMFQLTNIPLLGVVENMSSFICDSCDKEHNIFLQGGGKKIAKEYKTELLGKIPLEQKLAEASDEGKPIVLSFPGSKTAKEYFTLAKKLHEKSKQLEISKTGLDDFSLTWQKA